MTNASSIDLPQIKVLNDDIGVEFAFSISTVPAEMTEAENSFTDGRNSNLNFVESQIQNNQNKLDLLNQDIDRLTNHADYLDYSVAVGSGLLAGLIDSLWVGEFDFKSGKKWSNKTVNDFVMNTANNQGYKGERLDSAIKFLEEKFPVPTDNIWKGKDVGISARSHHLDDLAHHPTPIGLFFSILTQFTKTGYFQNGEGDFLPISVDENGLKLIGSDIKSKIFCGTVNWFFHLVSDMSGSNKTAGVGMGIPGPIVSMLKELSANPVLNQTGLPQKLKEIFVKEQFDLRSEMAVLHELGRQAVPVVINEVLVRAFFFIRRMVSELNAKQSFKNIDWRKTLPWHNRTIARMLTIATGTFAAMDLADAAIRGGMKSGGNLVGFAYQFVLRVNFIGVGRFAIAAYSDVTMGLQREKLRNDRIAVLTEQLHWVSAKVFYLQANVWHAAENTQISLSEAEQMMRYSSEVFIRAWEANRTSLRQISNMKDGIQRHNPKLIGEILSTFTWS